MRRVLMLMSVVSLGCILGLAPVGLAQTAGFTQIAPTGAVNGTFANGVNDSSGSCMAPGWSKSPGEHTGQVQGQHVGLCNNPNAIHTSSQTVVGFYFDSGRQPNSFTLSGGSFSPVSVAGALHTIAYGINSAGQIVGAYVDSNQQVHGFVLTGGTATTIDVPGALATIASGINSAGQVVGNFNDGMGNHGFVYSGGSSGTFTSFDYNLEPGVRGTFATGINASGQVVGYYYTSSWGMKSFQRSSTGSLSALNIQGALMSQAQGINTAGQVVGVYVDSTNFKIHGFVYSGGSATTVDIPNMLATEANGIDDAGTIVGEYVDPTNLTQYGFHMP